MAILDDELKKQKSTLKNPWEEKRKKGKLRFILMDGVLGWGMMVAILVTIINLLFDSKVPIWANFITYPIAGIFYGWMMWTFLERKYQQHLPTKEKNSTKIKTMKKELNFESGEEITPEPEIIEMTGKIVAEQFYNKAGRLIQGVEDLFLETENGRFFIKFYGGKVLRDDVKKYIDQPIRVKGYQTEGLWDATNNNMQSRIGKYVLFFEIME